MRIDERARTAIHESFSDIGSHSRISCGFENFLSVAACGHIQYGSDSKFKRLFHPRDCTLIGLLGIQLGFKGPNYFFKPIEKLHILSVVAAVSLNGMNMG